MNSDIGLQIYTVRDLLAKEYCGTLAAIAAIGYKFIEVHDLHGNAPETVRKACDDSGLSILSMMFPLPVLSQKIPLILKQAEVLGFSYVVCPYLSEDFRNRKGYQEVAQILNQAGKVLAREGLTLCYHNHAFELEPLDAGTTGFDILYENTDPEYLKAELDIYWLQYGGRDPLLTLQNFTGRVPLLHVKDMAAGEKKKFAEVGSGILDIPSIVRKAESCGVECFIVEQDGNWKCSSIESARSSYTFLSSYIA